jgi:hypothetical protein
MSGLGFLCLLGDAGDAAARLCADIAAHAQPGDEVILVDDTGPVVNFHTSAVVRHFGAMQGWPPDVRVHLISTGVRGAGDTGIAVNLALAEARVERLIVLPGQARLGPGFAAVRAAAEGHDLLVAAVTAPEVIGPKSASAHLGRLIFARDLAAGLTCAEGGDAGGDLRLLAGLLARAERPGVCDDVLAHLPPLPPVTPDWLDQWRAHLPDAVGLLEEALEGACVGTRAIMGAALAQVPGEDALLAEARRLGAGAFRTPIAAPAVLSGAPIRIANPGRHGHRSPLGYAALRPLWAGVAELVSEPDKADLIIYAHPWDVNDMGEDVARALDKRPEVPLALLSEEPFWDSLFSPDPVARSVTLSAAHLGQVVLEQRNHHTSPVFDFDRIPYFLLTDPAYAARYVRMFTRNAALSAQDWQAGFAARAKQAVFMAERRDEAFHDITIAAAGIVGLCAWRTRLAEGYRTGKVARLGASWQEEAAPRQHLPDWHADKLAQLDGAARFISGVENTHQPTYLSEKLFDAFACGARPLYLAQPSHRLHGMGLPAAAWVNLAGMTPDQAVRSVDAAPWDAGFYAAYAQAQSLLAALWCDPAVIKAEQARLGRALRAELVQLVAKG